MFVKIEEVYKTVDGRNLKIYIFNPKKSKQNGAAIVFFHGGGWFEGMPDLCFDHAEYFTEAGFTCFSVEYRLAKPNIETPIVCMEDAGSAVKWIALNAEKFHIDIDKEKFFYSGFSAGGHLASLLGIVEPYNTVIPRGFVLWYPCVDTARDDWFRRLDSF